MSEGTKGVTVSLGSGLRCDLEVRNHHLYADEPEKVGGTNKGPTPSEMLLLSLGACTAMTLRMYAERKGWPLEAVDIELDHAWVSREEWEDWPEGDERKKLPRITRKIRVKGSLSDEQMERLHYIAGRCPVHRTITESPAVVDAIERA